jgi:hypothetical protein
MELRRDKLEDLDQAFQLTAARNNEIAFSWLRIAIRNGYEPAFERLENFLLTIGRTKFIGFSSKHSRRITLSPQKKSSKHWPLGIRGQ